ncbi:MAG: GNAT family N-acetyltransferase [Clostridia bacterium]|nr:GNAT family N-acetyltransferase [Clostridia bacterium]
MLEIKPYSPVYKEDMQKVCLNTAYATAYEPVERNYLLNSYCDYYVDNEPETCFAAVDENGTAQGYIICAPDFKKFIKQAKPYIRQSKKSGFDHYCEGIAERLALRAFSRSYPAHFHIDINGNFQGKGTGTQLMNTLLDTLKSKNVKGVMLITGSGNVDAIRFYRRFGFKTVIGKGPAAVMGLKLR